MYRPIALIAAAFLALAGCATYKPAVLGMGDLTAAEPTGEGPAGYLGLTLALDLGTFTGLPSVLIDLKGLDDGKEHYFKVSGDQLATVPHGQQQIGVVMTLAPGRYVVTKTQLFLPGGRVKNKEYEPSQQALGLERNLQTFAIEPGKLVHLAVVKLALKENLVGSTLYYQTSTLVELARPDQVAWQGFQPLLAKAGPTYLKQTQIGTYAWPPLTWNGAEPPAPSAPASPEGTSGAGSNVTQATKRPMLTADQIRKVTHSKEGAVEACHLHNSPKAHGHLELKYIIAPDGHVHEVNVTHSSLGAEATEKCIIGVYRGLKFPATPDDDFETWTTAWTF